VPMEAQTICIHGDTPGAERIAEVARRGLEGAGIEVKPMGTR
jgi:5-oxoprolinase (ATP-hydrolysing) subunit A